MERLRVAPEIGYAIPSALTTVTINMTDTPSFVGAFHTVPERSNVSFHLVNQGAYVHTFTLSAVPNLRLDPAWSPGQLGAFFAANGSLANVSVGSGGQGWANVTFGAADALASFEFVSVVPYQFQAGMWGLINVTSVGPGLVIQEGTVNVPNVGFVPNALAAIPAQYPVVLNVLVTNLGSFPHTFTVVPQSNVTLTFSNFTGYFTQHAPLTNTPIPASTGGTAWANFTVAGPGIYQYLCEVPGHFQAGMSGFLYVGIPPPAPPQVPSTAIVEGWVLIGSGVLLILGVAIATVAAYVGRFPSEPKTHDHRH